MTLARARFAPADHHLPDAGALRNRCPKDKLEVSFFGGGV
jgi:hypothetical protein